MCSSGGASGRFRQPHPQVSRPSTNAHTLPDICVTARANGLVDERHVRGKLPSLFCLLGGFLHARFAIGYAIQVKQGPYRKGLTAPAASGIAHGGELCTRNVTYGRSLMTRRSKQNRHQFILNSSMVGGLE